MSKRPDFQDVLTDLDGGELHRMLTEQWPIFVAQCIATNKVGTITLQLKVKPDAKRRVVVSPTLKINAPAPSANATILWVDDEGNTHDHDPLQVPLKMIEPTPIRGAKEK